MQSTYRREPGPDFAPSFSLPSPLVDWTEDGAVALLAGGSDALPLLRREKKFLFFTCSPAFFMEALPFPGLTGLFAPALIAPGLRTVEP